MLKKLKDICNPVVFDEIYKNFVKDLKQFLYFKFKDRTKTDDVLQDTFVKLWTNCDKVDYQKVKSYLFTVANHLFLDIKRHEKTIQNHENTSVNYNQTESPEFLLIEKEYYEAFQKILNRLPERQREIFILNRIEKKKYKEIAGLLGISVKTVEKHMHNALVFMREHLGRKI